MNINVKRKNLFLIDDISPYKNFINARKTLRNIYLKSRKKEEEQKARTIVTRNNNIYQNIKIKLKTEKTPMKPYSQKLLKDQKFIISHLFKENEIKNDNRIYDSNSLMKTLNRLNYNNINKDKIKLMGKISHNNIFKTLPNENIKKGYKSVKKQKMDYENLNLPKIKYIFKKKIKLKI
jgi:hypothetical protein